LLWDYDTPGIPDELFDRDDEVPITKEDIRSLVISKLRLKKDSSAIDIGCGSGSITVELCWGDTKRVIELGIDRLQKGGRIVIDTILIETMYKTITTINEAKLNEVDITQVTISKGRKVSTGTMITSRNPVMIISATK
jgi:cobalt-precorrin-6B (C15)-methyltransferase